MEEIERIQEAYTKRQHDKRIVLNEKKFHFNYYMTAERELKYLEIIKSKFEDTKELKLLEIGAGSGYNLYFFARHGFQLKNIWANELLEDRFKALSINFPNCTLIEGNALDIKPGVKFNVILQSTVFSSILSAEIKKKMADKLLGLLDDNGIILSYDFLFDNPKNKDVKGIPKKEIQKLFDKSSKIKFTKVTLAPPVGRRIGKLYPLVNSLFPFLRTHCIATIYK
jgi:hypothetical protein